MASLLIVDDNPHLRMFARIVAEHVGWEICAEAECGEQAIQQALAELPDLVLMDYHLPDINGVTATARVKAVHPEIAVMAWSSSDDPAVPGRFLAAGAVAHLVKTDLAALQKALSGQLVTRTRSQASWSPSPTTSRTRPRSRIRELKGNGSHGRSLGGP